MNLNQWAIKWQIPFDAVEDLRAQFGMTNTDPKKTEGDSEAAVQVKVRIEASDKGGRLWRNNKGVGYNETGQHVRFGLANDTKSMSKKIKSSDLIGLSPIKIQPHHVGQIIGQFVAREIKKSNWIYKSTEDEIAQLDFLQLVSALGGDAAFATGEGTISPSC